MSLRTRTSESAAIQGEVRWHRNLEWRIVEKKNAGLRAGMGQEGGVRETPPFNGTHNLAAGFDSALPDVGRSCSGDKRPRFASFFRRDRMRAWVK